MDVFTPITLNRVVQDLRGQNTFLLDRYFPNVQQETTEEIHFDTVSKNRRLAPFVSPLVPGQIVERKGFQVKSFKPAYVKDKRVFDATAPLKRTLGESFTAPLSMSQRLDALVAQELQDQQDMLKLRLEVMAAQVMLTGGCTISGDNYPTQVIDFGRDSSLEISLSGTSEWGDSGVDPLDLLEVWAQAMVLRTGIGFTDVVMEPKAWGLFKNSASVITILNRTRDVSTLKPYSPPTTYGDAQFRGMIGDFNIFTYQNYYIDPADNTTKQVMPDYSVIGASPALEGYRAFGAIRDEESGFQPLQSYTKSWIEKDPAVRYLLMQSAPLIVPYRPDASFAAIVHA